MRYTIEEIHSIAMFSGLLMGEPKPHQLETDKAVIETYVGDEYPIVNLLEIKWKLLADTNGKVLGYGTWGHACGVKLTLTEDGETMYSISIIFNILPEEESIPAKLNELLGEIDWKGKGLMWNIVDL